MSSPEQSQVICPLCQRPNPPDVEYCQHCGGAIAPPVNPVTILVTRAISRFVHFRPRRRNQLVMVLSRSLIPLVILVAIILPVTYYTTDLIVKPVQGLSSVSNPGEWAMFRYDPAHSGVTGNSNRLPEGKLKWIFSTGTAIHSSPAVADGTIYFGNRNSKLFAVDAATAEKLWEFQAESWVESSPSVAHGMVYFGSNDGNLYALNASSGQEIWRFSAGYPITASPAIAGDTVYIGTDNYFLYALDAFTGALIWEFDTNGLVKSSPVVSDGVVYAGTNASYLYGLNAVNGRLRLQFLTAYPIYTSPVVIDGTVYFVNSNGYLTAVDGDARTWPREHEIRPYWTQMWLFGIPFIPTPVPESGLIWGTRLDPVSTSSPAVSGDNLYVGMKEKLVVVNLSSRERIWEFRAGGTISATPAVTDTAVFVASEDGYLYTLSTESGEKLWDIFIGGRLTSSPALADGTLYIGAHDGNLYAIE